MNLENGLDTENGIDAAYDGGMFPDYSKKTHI